MISHALGTRPGESRGKVETDALPHPHGANKRRDGTRAHAMEPKRNRMSPKGEGWWLAWLAGLGGRGLEVRGGRLDGGEGGFYQQG